jgi:hypothetical protein
MHGLQLGVSAREGSVGKFRKLADRSALLFTPKKNEEAPSYLRSDEEP